ncbi:hypothetical protein DSECCO2_373770 [anaerobic digester metagenome]
MSLNIRIIGSNKTSDEYKSAIKLKTIIGNSITQNVIGEIVLVANATLYGQSVKDVDLLMIGTIRNYTPQLHFIHKKEVKKDKIEICTFCTVIEIKSHEIGGISREGTDIYVKYGTYKHCVTEQSNKQKFSIKKFFETCLGFSPYITNLIWFTGATEYEVNELLRQDNGEVMPSNLLGNIFTFEDMMQLLVLQNEPYYNNNKYYFNSIYSGYSVEDFTKALNLFSHAKEGMGQLTRNKIEQISHRKLNNKDILSNDAEILIYRGRAGTGKTIGLIQTALDLIESDKGRVIILTYNQALVCDIKRLLALAEIPDMFSSSCVGVKTMHSFFYHIMNAIFYDGNLSSEEFLSNYYHNISELKDFFKEGGITKKDYFEVIKKDMANLNWDYVFIDEAQDWCNDERDLILNLFDKGHILVADGGQQFVRNNELCDWSIIKNRKNIKLKYCLRQKKNIINFLNRFSEKYLGKENDIRGIEEMVGGKVIITTADYLHSSIHTVEIQRLHKYGNVNYDMLYLVPPQLVKTEDGQTHFRYKEQYEMNGIHIWDGTDNEIRHTYPTDLNEVRLLQYESSRGLEGWTVICLEFDEFLHLKEQQYIPYTNVNDLLLESDEDKKKKYLYNWAMIPLTRAIDTLVITIKNENSNIGSLFKQIADECPDYVQWI